MFIARILVAIFFSFLTANQVFADKLGPLEVLDVLKKEFDGVNGQNPHEQQRYKNDIATIAVHLIVTSELSPLHCSEDCPQCGTFYKHDQFTPQNLYGTTIPHRAISYRFIRDRAPHLIDFGGAYQSFGFASKVATVSQKTSYVEWFIKAANVGVDVDRVLYYAASMEEIYGSSIGRNHVEACRVLWEITNKAKDVEDFSRYDSIAPPPPIITAYKANPSFEFYFNERDQNMTESKGFASFYNKLTSVSDKLY